MDVIKSRGHQKNKQSMQIPNLHFVKTRNDQNKLIEFPNTEENETNLNTLKKQYRHRRMQSKNALVNHYKSLSLMNGDDFSKILT